MLFRICMIIWNQGGAATMVEVAAAVVAAVVDEGSIAVLRSFTLSVLAPNCSRSGWSVSCGESSPSALREPTTRIGHERIVPNRV